MQDRWYGDNRDLIKWGVLLKLAENFGAERVLQLAFYRPRPFGQIVIDGQNHDIPKEVIVHFRNLRMITGISSKIRVTVFDPVFQNRATYLQAVLALLLSFATERCIVFLDPDTGLEPPNTGFAPPRPGPQHVLGNEVKAIWVGIKKDDVFVFYQHRTNRANRPWIQEKMNQLADALGVQLDAIRMARAPNIANDVVFFFLQRA